MGPENTPGDLIRILLPHQEESRFFLWTPVCIALGVALYFSLSWEPGVRPILACTALAFASVAGAFALRSSAAAFYSFAFCACVLVGFLASCLRSHTVATRIIRAPETARIEGVVISVQPLPDGDQRLIVAPLGGNWPTRLQLRSKGEALHLHSGWKISFLARIVPPPKPVEPLGFDYGRLLFFQGIGGVGYVLTKPEVLERPEKDFWRFLPRLRAGVTHRVQIALPGQAGFMATALITGEKSAISPDVLRWLQSAGVAHILAISGLHMALFCGAVFSLVRFLVALCAPLALRVSGKKVAAMMALVSGLFYLSISGAGAATQRSFIMVSLVFGAVLLDRTAISLRNVALSATLILLFEPDMLLTASFQMSFSAVVALICLYENWPQDRVTHSAYWQGALHKVKGLFLSSVVATLATNPFSAFHFHRMTFYGIIANLFAIPLMGFVVMPSALGALLLMPLGLERFPLRVMDVGMASLRLLAKTIAGWPWATIPVKQGPVLALSLITLGALWAVIWQLPRTRLLALLPLAVGIALWSIDRRPQLLVEENGKLVGLLDATGKKRVLSGVHPLYAARNWLLSDGDVRTPQEAVASFVVEVPPSWEESRQEGGALAVWLRRKRPVVLSVQQVRGQRPWV